MADRDFETPVHPGEILVEEFLKPLGLKPAAAARQMHIPRDRLAKIAAGRRAVSSDTALRLARLFGTTPQFWQNLQAAHDLRHAERALGAEISTIQPIASAQAA